MNLWTYWEGSKPEYIDVCLRSIQIIKDVDFHLVTPDNLHTYLPANTIHPDFAKLNEPALRADYIRCAILCEHGGMWWDADTVALRSPTHLIKNDPECIYTTWNKLPVRALNGYIYFRSNSELCKEWKRLVDQRLDKQEEVLWCGLGEQILTPLVINNEHATRVDRTTFLPIDIDSSVSAFFEPGNPDKFITSKTVCFGLNHSWFMYHKSDVINMEWNNSDILFHQLMNITRNSL